MAEELHVRFGDRAALEREYATNLAHGRAFVADAEGYEVFAPCRLVLHHPEHTQVLSIDCEVVMVCAEGPMRGVALQFCHRDQAFLSELRAFASRKPACGDGQPMQARAEAPNTKDPAPSAAPPEAPVEAPDSAFEFAPDEDEATEAPERTSLSAQRQQRLRNLSPAERTKIAQGHVLDDRVLLERIYGNVVWETLLRNPRITVPEVARMARKGTLPRPLLDLIVDNEQWIRQSVVRRALLSNPRLSADSAAKVLRTMNTRELKLVPQQTAYSALVRQAAQRLMRGG